jgi:hypothetical protein
MLNCGEPPDFAIAFQLACNKAASNTRATISGVTAVLFYSIRTGWQSCAVPGMTLRQSDFVSGAQSAAQLNIWQLLDYRYRALRMPYDFGCAGTQQQVLNLTIV